MPAFMRCAYRCNKEPTNWKGDESREKLAQVNLHHYHDVMKADDFYRD